MDSNELARRANAAWYRFGEPDTNPPVAHTEVVEHDDHLYVVLSSAADLLVVYRVRNDGQLKRLKRPPSWTGGTPKTKGEDRLYVIGSDKDRHIKIGSAADPSRHLARMQEGSPHVLRILLEHAGGSRLAEAVKRRLAPFNVSDSWFDLGAANPIALVTQTIKQIEVKS